MLSIRNLKAAIKNKAILKGVNLVVPKGELHVIMGPNGSGKSTLAQTIFSHPAYTITSGKIFFDKKDITGQAPDKTAKMGLMLAFQYPQTVPGVSVTNLLKVAMSAQKSKTRVGLKEFGQRIGKQAAKMNFPEEFLNRSLNEGFSGGEKKKAEVLQLSMLRPKFAVFDETDSGLDVDSLKVVAKEINAIHQGGAGVLLITHYQRVLKYLKPDRIHIMYQGKIVKSGGKDLAEEIEKKGYMEMQNVNLKDQNDISKS